MPQKPKIRNTVKKTKKTHWSARSKAIAEGYRSGLEHRLGQELKELGLSFTFEQEKLEYIIPASKHKYTPDFKFPNGIFIETKGRLTSKDRQKHEYVKSCNPFVDIRFIFSNPGSRLYKGSTTTYADWCMKHGFEYCSIKDVDIWKGWYYEC
jgi:hypothetical protein